MGRSEIRLAQRGEFLSDTSLVVIRQPGLAAAGCLRFAGVGQLSASESCANPETFRKKYGARSDPRYAALARRVRVAIVTQEVILREGS